MWASSRRPKRCWAVTSISSKWALFAIPIFVKASRRRGNCCMPRDPRRSGCLDRNWLARQCAVLLARHRPFAGMTAPPLSAGVCTTMNRGVMAPDDGGSKRFAAIVATVGFSALFVFGVLLAAGASTVSALLFLGAIWAVLSEY
jgi:hypothetical protein